MNVCTFLVFCQVKHVDPGSVASELGLHCLHMSSKRSIES